MGRFLAKYVKSWTFHVICWTFRDRERPRKPAQRKGLRAISGCAVNSIYKQHEKISWRKKFPTAKKFKKEKETRKQKLYRRTNHKWTPLR